ncbi:MAG: c-type cytochrome [Candidatus Poribacteria bacterium]|nr:c-type cytochrome [Candidatus Poribacteria bacterium]
MRNRSIALLMLIIGIVVGTLCCVVTHAQNAPEASERGKEVYEESCAHCHGTEGRGDGSAAENLLPRPRDFTRGLYKIRSTESGELPTDQDLYDIITEGMPGSSMPGWETSLSADDRWELVAYIKTFHNGFKEREAPPREITLAGQITYSEESVEIGKGLYTELGCIECHGNIGRGDGTSAPTLTDEWGFQTWPANLTHGWNYRGGSDTEDIFKRFIGGIAGSPMPAFEGDSFLHFGLTSEESKRLTELENKDEMTEAEEGESERFYEKMDEAVNVALNRVEGLELSADEQQIYDNAMKVVYEKSWHLANYVKSLMPEQRPEPAIGNNVLRSQYIQGELPTIDADAWETFESRYFPLVGQVVIEPRQFNPTIDAVSVKSFYNDTEVAFLFIWDDRTHTIDETNEETGETLEDALAVQFPVRVPQGPTAPKPYFLYGGRLPVYVWQWKASAPEQVTELTAKGVNNVEVQEVQGDLQATGTYTDGRYKLWVKRALRTDDKKDLQLDPGIFVPIAFSAWDGSNGDVGTKRVMTSWYTFVLEPVPSSRRFVYPPLIAVLSLGLLVGLRAAVQRRNSEA